MNGNIEGDEEGGYTFTGGRGETVIDYVIENKKVRREITKMKIGEEVDSVHYPVVIWIRGEWSREERNGIRGKEKEER